MPNERYSRLVEQDEDGWRHPAARDADRLLYATAWRRLEGVTQVTPVGGLSLIHNRLTHSLKVAQVGQRIAERLLFESPTLESEIHPLVVYAAGLAHDLGHPPFGHVAEKTFQDVLEYSEGQNRWALPDSFEGNAQTFRILTKLMVRKRDAQGNLDSIGLNLTRATLAAVSKYPWQRGRAEDRVTKVPASHIKYYRQKWGAFNSEATELREALSVVKGGRYRSLEAEIMDLADDIAYAIHDVEDYFRAGLIPLNEIGAGLRQQKRSEEFGGFMSYANGSLNLKSYIPYDENESLAWLESRAAIFPEAAYGDSGRDRVKLHDFASNLVQEIESRVAINGDGDLYIPDVIRGVLELLKELTWYYVINHPHLSTSQEGQRRIIKNLHIWLCEWVSETYKFGDNKDEFRQSRVRRNKRRLPARLVTLMELNARRGALPNYNDDQIVSRSVVDYIAGLTDAQANDLHGHLGGYGNTISTVSWLQHG